MLSKGEKLNYKTIAKQYLKSTNVEANIQTKIYQMKAWHKLFANLLNVVIIVKTNLTTGKTRHVILFSSDLELAYEKLIQYYKLRFQIEFNFRDAFEDKVFFKKTLSSKTVLGIRRFYECQ